MTYICIYLLSRALLWNSGPLSSCLIEISIWMWQNQHKYRIFKSETHDVYTPSQICYSYKLLYFSMNDSPVPPLSWARNLEVICNNSLLFFPLHTWFINTFIKVYTLKSSLTCVIVSILSSTTQIHATNLSYLDYHNPLLASPLTSFLALWTMPSRVQLVSSLWSTNLNLYLSCLNPSVTLVTAGEEVQIFLLV